MIAQTFCGRCRLCFTILCFVVATPPQADTRFRIKFITKMSTTAKLDSLAKQWAAGAIAGCTEAVITMPFEVLKTKMQVAGTGKWSLLFNKNIRLDTAFAGLTPVLFQTSMKIGIRYGAFEQLRNHVSVPLAGLGAGAFEALIWITPTERLKVLMISTTQENKSFRGALFGTLQSQGVKGLWRGGTATVLRNSSTVGARFWIVEHLKPFLSKINRHQQAMNSGIAGFLAGALTTVMNQPIDVVKTRMNADQVGHGKATYNGNLDCLRVIWREGGWRAFSAGFSARVVKISVGQGVIFFVYDLAASYLA
jgi:solute carrier family 25 citrate transporter 1